MTHQSIVAGKKEGLNTLREKTIINALCQNAITSYHSYRAAIGNLLPRPNALGVTLRPGAA